jgi:hypothetical protein
MNLTAKTGAVVVGGIAFLILSLLLDMSCKTWGALGQTYEAYAPRPIVFDTMRNGKSAGSGSSWDWKGILLSAIVLEHSHVMRGEKYIRCAAYHTDGPCMEYPKIMSNYCIQQGIVLLTKTLHAQ